MSPIDKAQLLIKYLAASGITAVIAGGYARDTIYQRPIKDVDLLVEVDNVEQMHRQMQDIETLTGAYLTFSGGTGYRDAQRRGDGSLVFGVMKSTVSTFGYPLDVIFTDDIETFIEGFPDDLSKVVFDGTVADPREESMADFVAKRITYRRPEGSPGHADRIARLTSKYPGFELVYKPQVGTELPEIDLDA